MSRIFVCHFYSSDPIESQARVQQIARRIALEGHLPLAPQIYLPAFIDEKAERDLALHLGLQLVALCNELRFYGSLSAGMRLEIEEARTLGIPIVKGELL